MPAKNLRLLSEISRFALLEIGIGYYAMTHSLEDINV